MDEIVFVGRTVGEAVFPDEIATASVPYLQHRKWNLLPGGIASAAFAAALAGDAEVKISAITNLGREIDNRLNAGLLHRLRQSKIRVISLPYAKPEIRIHERYGYHKFGVPEIVREVDFFQPDQTARLWGRDFTPSVSVFVDALTDSKTTQESTLNCASMLKSRGSLIILDMNPRKPVEEMAAARWAHLANIVKISDREIKEGFYRQIGNPIGRTPREVANAFIRAGVALVCHTQGEKGATLYWSKGRSLDCVKVPASLIDPVSLPLNIGDGAYCAGLALYCQREGLTGNNLVDIDPELAREMGHDANLIAASALSARNVLWRDGEPPLTSVYKPLAAYAKWDRLVRAVYPQFNAK
jgi:sugar/nucleoside kinase (ribokinase family)